MSEYLWAKTHAYEELLTEAMTAASAAPEASTEAAECLEMAEAYLEDGRHFLASDDLPNALAAFAYGHGWLDAGVRLGVLEAEDPEPFTI